MSSSCRPKNLSRLFFVLLLSSSYFVAEVVGGILSGSLALLADAGHMAIDVAAIALGLFAIWISQRPPTDEKSFGYYRAEILAALVNGAALVAISVWIIYEAILRIGHPTEVHGGMLTLVASGGLVVNLIALVLTHESRKSNLNMRGVWLHIASDTLGSVSAMLAGFLIWRFEWYLADPIISVMIALLILYGSWKLLSESVNVLLEGVPKELNLADIRTGLESLESIKDVHDLHVWCVTSGVHALSAHIRVEDGVDSGKVLEAVTGFLRERYQIDHSTIQLEPPSFTHQTLHF